MRDGRENDREERIWGNKSEEGKREGEGEVKVEGSCMCGKRIGGKMGRGEGRVTKEEGQGETEERGDREEEGKGK